MPNKLKHFDVNPEAWSEITVWRQAVQNLLSGPFALENKFSVAEFLPLAAEFKNSGSIVYNSTEEKHSAYRAIAHHDAGNLVRFIGVDFRDVNDSFEPTIHWIRLNRNRLRHLLYVLDSLAIFTDESIRKEEEEKLTEDFSIDEVVEFISLRLIDAKYYQPSIVLDLPRDTKVRGNKGLLAMTIYNIAKNGAKHGKAGLLKITGQVLTESNELALTFKDNGKGLPPELMERGDDGQLKANQLLRLGHKSGDNGGQGYGLRIADIYNNAEILDLRDSKDPYHGFGLRFNLPLVTAA